MARCRLRPLAQDCSSSRINLTAPTLATAVLLSKSTSGLQSPLWALIAARNPGSVLAASQCLIKSDSIIAPYFRDSLENPNPLKVDLRNMCRTGAVAAAAGRRRGNGMGGAAGGVAGDAGGAGPRGDGARARAAAAADPRAGVSPVGPAPLSCQAQRTAYRLPCDDAAIKSASALHACGSIASCAQPARQDESLLQRKDNRC